LHFLVEADQPELAIRTLRDALAPGSYIVASHATSEHDPVSIDRIKRVYHRNRITNTQTRTADEFTRLVFSGLQLVAPGVVLVSEWRPGNAGPRPSAAELNFYGGVALKP
jgi:hypothetical protein